VIANNQEMYAGLDMALAWVKTDVLVWYGFGGWLAFFLALGVAYMLYQLARRFF